MVLEQLLELFIYSRKHCLSGARSNATEKSVDNYRRSLKHFLVFLQDKRGRTKYEDVTRLDIRAFVEFVNSNEKWSESTRLSYMRSVRAILKFVEQDEECKEEGLKALSKVLPPIPQNPRRKYIPTPQDLRRWRNAFNTNFVFGYRDYAVFSLMMTTGMRIGEVCWLKLEHLQLDNNLVYVPNEGKTGARLVPVTDELVGILKGWLRRRSTCKMAKDSPYTFISKYDPHCTPGGFDQRFKKMSVKHSLPKLTPHTVRHAFCTYYLRNGGNIEKLRNITGHSSYDILKTYLHLAEVGGGQAKEELERVSPLKMLSKKGKE